MEMIVFRDFLEGYVYKCFVSSANDHYHPKDPPKKLVPFRKPGREGDARKSNFKPPNMQQKTACTDRSCYAARFDPNGTHQIEGCRRARGYICALWPDIVIVASS